MVQSIRTIMRTSDSFMVISYLSMSELFSNILLFKLGYYWFLFQSKGFCTWVLQSYKPWLQPSQRSIKLWPWP